MSGRSILFQIGVLAIAIILIVQAVSVAVVLLTPPPPAPRMSPARVTLALQDPGVARKEGWRRSRSTVPPFDTTGGPGALAAAGMAATLGADAGDIRVRMTASSAPGASRVSVSLPRPVPAPDAPDTRSSSLSGAAIEALAGAALMAPDFSLPPFEAAWRQPDGTWVIVRPPERAMGRWAARLALMLGVSLALIAPMTWWAARRLTRPVRALAEAAEQIQIDRAGDLTLPGASREIQAVAAALIGLRERLADQLDERTRMLTAVAHDLRTPLTGLRLRAEQAPAAARERMVQDIARMDAMISEVLDYAAARTPAGTGGAERIDLVAVARDALDALGLGPEMLTVRGAAVPAIAMTIATAGPERARRILVNLIHNAVRYAGEVTVEVRASDDSVEVRVLDRGPGLDPDLLETVFEPFYRLEGSRSRDTGGVGLGLAIARALAQADGGEVGLKPRPGGGLVARLRYPQAAD